MPSVRMNTTEAEVEEMKKLLPPKPFTITILLPALKKHMNRYLLQALRAEIEIYKAYPKKNNRYDKMTFEPRNNEKCFMGQGFMANSEGGDILTGYNIWYDADLVLYREKIGKINHGTWGNCTLLEIWAADHFEKWRSMVKAVHQYCFGERPKLPRLLFKVSPFLITEETGKVVKGERQRQREKEQQEEYQDLIIGGLRAKMRAQNRQRESKNKNRH